jgi:hypothetical protein
LSLSKVSAQIIMRRSVFVSNPAARAQPEAPSHTISLHIKHPTIDPNAITGELGLTPDHAWACGEPKRSGAASTQGGVRRNSFWCAPLAPLTSADTRFTLLRDSAKLQRAVEMVTQDLASQLSFMLLQLRRHQAFFQRLVDEGGELSFVVEVPTADLTGFKLDPTVTRQLAALGATLELQFV